MTKFWLYVRQDTLSLPRPGPLPLQPSLPTGQIERGWLALKLRGEQVREREIERGREGRGLRSLSQDIVSSVFTTLVLVIYHTYTTHHTHTFIHTGKRYIQYIPKLSFCFWIFLKETATARNQMFWIYMANYLSKDVL